MKLMNIKISSLIYLLLILNNTSLSFAQNFDWARQFGGPSSESGNAIVADADGNIYTTGYFNDSVDFDPGMGSYYLSAVTSGFTDIFITKTDSAGNLIWAKTFGGIDNDNALSLAIQDEYIYITGFFQETVDFDPGAGTSNLTSSGAADIFLSKFNTAGDFIWVKQMGGSSSDFCQSIQTDDNGYIYITGGFSDTVDFDPGPLTLNLTAMGADIFIAKLDSLGALLWAKSIGGSFTDIGNGICTDTSGNLYVTGEFNNITDFDPGAGVYNLTSISNIDIFILKLDGNGNFVWAKQMGGANPESGKAIAIDPSNNIVITGEFRGDVNFDPGNSNFILNGGTTSDIYIAKLDGAGNFQWAKKMGGGQYELAYGISTDASGNIYSTGIFAATADFDPGPGIFNFSVLGGNDSYISKLDQSGNFVWAKQIGGIDIDIAQAIFTDENGTVYITGYFASTADFDPGTGIYNLSSLGNTDIFIVKLLGNTTTVTTSKNFDTNLIAYPNPTTAKLRILSTKSFQHAKVLLRNILGEEIISTSFTADTAIELNLEHYAKGLYFVNVTVDNNTTSSVFKIILQ